MRVTVHYLAQIKRAAGCGSESVEGTKTSCLRDILHTLAERHDATELRLDDLNRQLLMSHAGLGQLRIEQATRRLREFNPHVEIVPVAENICAENVDRLVREADLVASCAPLFQERLLLNRAAVE